MRLAGRCRRCRLRREGGKALPNPPQEGERRRRAQKCAARNVGDGWTMREFPRGKAKRAGMLLDKPCAKHIINVYDRPDFPAGQRVDKALMGPMTAGCRSQRESPRLEGFHRHRSAPPRSFRSIPDESAALRRDRVAARCAAIWVVPRRLTASSLDLGRRLNLFSGALPTARP